MAKQAKFKIDLKQSFPSLAKPPIVEAVFHCRARATTPLDRETLPAILRDKLPEYPTVNEHFEAQVILEMSFAGDPAATKARGNAGWNGLRLRSSDQAHIVVFGSDGLIYSRLEPYPGWGTFEAEARRTWQVFEEVAIPKSVDRLAVRFINRIPLEAGTPLADYLNEPPTEPGGLPLTSFLYQSAFELAHEGLVVNVIKTMQGDDDGERSLILDIDVATREPLEDVLDPRAFDHRLNALLPKMRWLKNKVFFDLLRPSQVKSWQMVGQS